MQWLHSDNLNCTLRNLLFQANQNAIPFGYVLADSWYTNADNTNAVFGIDKHWLGAFKTNLEVALSRQGHPKSKKA